MSFTHIIDTLENVLTEIDSLLSVVETLGRDSAIHIKIQEHISLWNTGGSILDGGASIRLDEGNDLRLDPGIHNIYDVLLTMYTESHRDS
jgi:hypothetical protein